MEKLCEIDPSCQNTAYKACYVCSKLYCEAHQSRVEPDACNDCCAVVEEELKRSPAKGNDDSSGTLIEIVNNKYFVSTARSCAEMSDSELERMINTFTNKVHSLESATDRSRITLSMFKMEKDERFLERAAKMRGVKLPSVSTNGKVTIPRRISNDPEKVKASLAAAASTSLGIEEKDLHSLLQALIMAKK